MNNLKVPDTIFTENESDHGMNKVEGSVPSKFYYACIIY